MADQADAVVANEDRAMELFEADLRQRRIAESMRGYDPNAEINCVDCSELVPRERLQAYPHTRRCTRCASDVESGYRRNDF